MNGAKKIIEVLIEDEEFGGNDSIEIQKHDYGYRLMLKSHILGDMGHMEALEAKHLIELADKIKDKVK